MGTSGNSDNVGNAYKKHRESFDFGRTGKTSKVGTNEYRGRGKAVDGLKMKDLIGIPWRVAFALQADGWYLRQDIIWHKPNPMPESVRDRCTKAHEYIFLLSKSPKYYYDNEAIKEDSIYYDKDKRSDKGNIRYEGKKSEGSDKLAQDSFVTINEKKNKRSVWKVSTKPYKAAHFATFPVELIEPCVLAGCPEGGTVLDPFGGAGTTALAALVHNRKSVLIELNEEYIEIAKERLAPKGHLFTPKIEIDTGEQT
jgi:DNA modification methylase